MNRGLPPMEWEPTGLEKDGMHYRMGAQQRIEIYKFLASAIRDAWKEHGEVPIVALCKDPPMIREIAGLDHDMCNCGP